jgi:hypothetical protein
MGNVISGNLDYCCLSLFKLVVSDKSNNPALPDAVTYIPCDVCLGQNTMPEQKKVTLNYIGSYFI